MTLSASDNDNLYLVRLLNSAGEEVSLIQAAWQAIPEKSLDFSSIVMR